MTSYGSIVWAVVGASMFTYGYLQRQKGVGGDAPSNDFAGRVEQANRSENRSQGMFTMIVGALFVVCAIVS